MLAFRKLNFTTKAGVDPLTYIFYISLTYVLKMCPKNFLNIPIKYRIYDEKTCFLVFLRPFWIFTPKPEIEFSNQGYSALFPAKPDHMPFKFWKYLNHISKFRQKHMFFGVFAAILNFYAQTGNIIFKSRVQCPIPGKTWSYAV